MQEPTDILSRTKPPKGEILKHAIDNPLLIIRELNNRSFFNFLQFFWEDISGEELKVNWHMEYICNELQKVAEQVAISKPKKADLIINVPPGTSKTTMCSIMFPAWCWSKWHWMKFICVSYSAALSLESAEFCRDLVRSDRFQAIYPELKIKEDKDTKSNFRIIKEIYEKPGQRPRIIHGGNRFSTSVGGSLTGFHGHILIVDDPINPQQAVSAKELENANRWMEQTLPTRKVDKAVAATVMIMQRLHQDDPTGHTLKKKNKPIHHICLPGELKNYGEFVEPKELAQFYEDDLLDPVRLNWNVLGELMADLGQYGYAGQIGQNPTPPGGGMFKVDHFQVINTMPASVNIEMSVRYWDKAGTADGGAYTTGVKLTKLRGNHWIIEDVRRGQWASEEREKIIKETAYADGPGVHILVEQEPGSGGKESAENTIRNLAGFAVYADRPQGDKVYRADPFSVQVNNGNVYLFQGLWNNAYIEECRYFPFGTYKDQVDASAAGFNYLCHKKLVRRIT
jgi:predicted phage terminase large subunit-like protein